MARIDWGIPYTHGYHTRKGLAGKGRACNWCGKTPRVLYQYDGEKEEFCNKECRSSYVCRPGA